MKKIFYIMMASTLMLVACGKEKQFDENLQIAYEEMGKTLMTSAYICNKTAETWHEAIYKNRAPSGKYCSDFNDALAEIFKEYRMSGILDSLTSYTNKMQATTSKLNNPPSGRMDCYNEFVEIVAETSSFSRMAIDPSGSLSTYNTQINETAENISKKIDQFKIKYAEYIRFGED